MSETRKIVKNTSILASYFAFESITVFIFTVLCARLLGVEEFGRLSYLLSFVLLFSMFSDCGTSFAISKLVAAKKDNRFDYINNGFTVRVFLVICTVGITGAFFSLFGFEKDFFLVLVLASSEAFRNVAIYICYVFRGFQKMKYEPLILGVERVFLLLVGSILLILGYAVEVIVYVYFVARFLSLILSVVLFKREYGMMRFAINKRCISGIYREAAPIFILMVCDRLNLYLAPVLLTQFHGLESTGIFQAAIKIVMLPIVLCSTVSQSLFPAMVANFKIGRKDKTEAIKRYGVKQLLNLVFPCSILFFFFSQTIVNILYGSGYTNSTQVIKVMTLYIVFMAILSMAIHLLAAIDKQNEIARLSLLNGSINVVFVVVLTWAFSYQGVAWALTLSAGIMSVIYTVRISHHGISLFNLSDCYSQFGSGLIMFITMWILKYFYPVDSTLSFILSSLFGLVAYGVVMIISGGISLQERKFVRSIFSGV